MNQTKGENAAGSKTSAPNKPSNIKVLHLIASPQQLTQYDL